MEFQNLSRWKIVNVGNKFVANNLFHRGKIKFCIGDDVDDVDDGDDEDDGERCGLVGRPSTWCHSKPFTKQTELCCTCYHFYHPMTKLNEMVEAIIVKNKGCLKCAF